MAELTIAMSRKNLSLLVKHVFIGNWILTANRAEGNEENDAFYDLILSIAKNYNVMEDIVYNEKSNDYDLAPEKEEELMKEIHEYEEEAFWDELVGKLAARDAITKHGEAKFEKLGRVERMKAIWAEEEKYHEEFDKKGVMRLHIKK